MIWEEVKTKSSSSSFLYVNTQEDLVKKMIEEGHIVEN